MQKRKEKRTEREKEIEDSVSRGTTDRGKVKCLYIDQEYNFCLTKWPGAYDGRRPFQTWISPCVRRYTLGHFSYSEGVEVWDSSPDKDGPLRFSALARLIERERSKTNS